MPTKPPNPIGPPVPIVVPCSSQQDASHVVESDFGFFGRQIYSNAGAWVRDVGVSLRHQIDLAIRYSFGGNLMYLPQNLVAIEFKLLGAGVQSATVNYGIPIKYDGQGTVISQERTYTVHVSGTLTFTVSAQAIDGQIFLPTLYTSSYFTQVVPEGNPTLSPTDLWKNWPYPVTGSLSFDTWFMSQPYMLGKLLVNGPEMIGTKDVLFAQAWAYLPNLQVYLTKAYIQVPSVLNMPYDLNASFTLIAADSISPNQSRAYGVLRATGTSNTSFTHVATVNEAYGSVNDRAANYDYFRIISQYNLVKAANDDYLSKAWRVPSDYIAALGAATGFGWRLLDSERSNLVSLGGDGSKQWVNGVFHNTVPYASTGSAGSYGKIQVYTGYVGTKLEYQIDWYTQLWGGYPHNPHIEYPETVNYQSFGYAANSCNVYNIYSFEVKTDELVGLTINGQGVGGTYGNEPLVVFPPNDGNWHTVTGKVPASSNFTISWYYRQFPVANGTRYSIRNLKFGTTDI